MARPQNDEFHFPLGRWLLLALVAVVGLIGVVFFFAWLADEEDPEGNAGGEVGEQIEWSIILADQGGQTITLKGDLPDGITTETWNDDIQVSRNLTGSFEWDMSEELPVAVVAIDEAEGCGPLNTQLDQWVDQVGAAGGEAQNLQARAFAQHALDRMRADGCEIDDSALQDAIG